MPMCGVKALQAYGEELCQSLEAGFQLGKCELIENQVREAEECAESDHVRLC